MSHMGQIVSKCVELYKSKHNTMSNEPAITVASRVGFFSEAVNRRSTPSGSLLKVLAQELPRRW
jgi:hypothetical protein